MYGGRTDQPVEQTLSRQLVEDGVHLSINAVKHPSTTTLD
jgi:hypothetical protein